MPEQKRIEDVTPNPKMAKEVVKDHAHTDIFAVKGGNPEYEYYWARYTNPNEPGGVEYEKLFRGREVVRDQKIETLGKKVDGEHRIGDAILMSRPKKMAEEEARRVRELADRRMRRDREELRENFAKMGIRLVESPED